MARPLLNYTTQVPVERTVAEIGKILVRHGATSIRTDYERGMPVAVAFAIATRFGTDGYRLPARIDRVTSLMKTLREAGELPPRYASAEQAARVAWRIAKDWIEAQLALVEAHMVDLEEVFLPYLHDGRSTFFERYAESRKSLPSPGEAKRT